MATAFASVHDVVVVGGGIIGLATARALARRFVASSPTFSVVVLEKEKRLASHQSSHNSGVVHAGLYYRPGSQRALLGVKGAAMMRDFAKEDQRQWKNGSSSGSGSVMMTTSEKKELSRVVPEAFHSAVPYIECGKLVMAVTGPEVRGLISLFARSLVNQVPEVQLWLPQESASRFSEGLLDSSVGEASLLGGYVDTGSTRMQKSSTAETRIERLKELTNVHVLNRAEFDAKVNAVEPAFSGNHVFGAIWSPVSGIISFEHVAHTYARELVRSMKTTDCVRTNFEAADFTRGPDSVITIQPRTGSEHQPVKAKFVISCAGLYSDRVASLTGGSKNPMVIPVRGEWRKFRPEYRSLVKGLVYPVPNPKFPFLGIHATNTVHGDVIFGPNAVLATAREGYKPSTVSIRDLLELGTSPSLWKLALRDWQSGLGELYRAAHTPAYVKLLRQYLPTITTDQLESEKITGVRAMALNEQGRMVDDFVFGRSLAWQNVLHVRNAPSPAATASLAIAEQIVDQYDACRSK